MAAPVFSSGFFLRGRFCCKDMGNLFSRSVEAEYEGRTARITIPSSNFDLTATYFEICKKLAVPPSQIITGFVCDDQGGPICPFKIWGGLRGNERCSIITRDHRYVGSPYEIPRPPSVVPPGMIPDMTVKWEDFASPHASLRSSAASRLLASIKAHGFGFIEADDAQHEAWMRNVDDALKFFDRPLEVKNRTKVNLSNGKFVGYSDQKKRQFFQVRTVDQKGGFPWPRSRPLDAPLNQTSEAQNDETGGVASVEGAAAAAVAASGELVHVKIEGGDEDEDEDGRERSEMEDSFVDMYMHLSKCSRTVLKEMCPLLGLDTSSIMSMVEGGEDGPSRNRLRGPGGKRLSHVGPDVYRVYQLFRPAGSQPPGLRDPATGIHADMGLLTVAPAASLPGLTVLSQDCVHWIDVESSKPQSNIPEPLAAPALVSQDPVSCSCGHAVDPDRSEAFCSACGASQAPPLAVPSIESVPPESGPELQTAKQAEYPKERTRFVVFCGETLARLTRGSVKAVLHYVDERVMGEKRISAPFFLRAIPEAIVRCPSAEGAADSGKGDMTVHEFMTDVVLSARPWVKPPPEKTLVQRVLGLNAPGSQSRMGVSRSNNTDY